MTTTVTSPVFITHKQVRPADNEPGNIDVKLTHPVYTTITTTPALEITPLKIKPSSILYEPWTAFGALQNRSFIDDFCHEKEFTLKAEASTYNGTVVKLKQTANISKTEIKTKEELKVYFPIYSRMASALQVRLTEKDTRIHYDHGIDAYKKYSYNLYGSFGFLRDWKKYNFKVGVQLLEKNATIDNRLKFNLKQELTWFMKATAAIDNFSAGVITVLDLNNRDLIKKDLLFGYRMNEYDVSLIAQQSFDKKTLNYQNWKQWFSKYLITATYSRTTKQKYGLELNLNPQEDNHVVTGLVEYKYSDKGVTKIKLDSKLNLTFLIKKALSSKLALSLGVFAPLNNKVEKNKYGVQVNLNI